MKNGFIIKVIFITVLQLNLFHFTFSQELSETDSLKELLNSANGKERIELLIDLTWKLRNSEIQNAINYATEAVELTQKYNDSENLTKAYSFLGVAYRNIGNYSKAFDYYYKGLESAKKYNIKDQEGYAYINISNLYLYQEYYSDALKNLQEAKKIAEEIGNKNILGYYYINRGRVELKLKNYTEALDNLNTAAEIRKGNENSEGYATCLKYIGDVYKEQEDYTSALNYYKESIENLEYTFDPDLVTNNYNEISDIYYKEKNYDQAIYYATKSYEIAQKIGSKLRLRNACLSLMMIHKTQKNYKQALIYLEKVLNYNDTLFNQELNEKISHIKFINEKYEYDKKLSDLNYQYQIDIQEQKEIRKILIIAGAAFILLSIMFFLFFRVKRKVNDDLRAKNSLIEKQKEKLENSIEEIRVSNVKLKELNDTKDKFFTILAHDLKNPFGNILNFSDLLKSNYDTLSAERQKEFIFFINKCAENTYKLLENLLLWSRAQIGAIDFNPRTENVYDISLDTLDLIGNSAKLKSITLHNEIPKDIFIKADKELYITIIRNLLTNAVKFTPKGKNISICAEKNNGETIISIIDEGIGISEEKMGKLFSVSESISTKGTDDEDGSGIGLILCKEFIEMHGGKIKIQSKVNEGTNISFNLPAN